MHFQSGGFDLGLYDQAVWRFSQFLDPYNTVKQRIIFGDHFVLTLPFLSPLFYLWDDVRALLLLQAAVISASVIPIYLIAVKRLRSRVGAWAVMILYGLFFGIQYGVFFDFHPIIIGVSLLSLLAWAIEYKKKTVFWIVLVLCLLTQENMGIAVMSLGFLYIFRAEYRRTAFFLIISGICYTLLSLKIISSLSPIGYEYQAQIPQTIPEILYRLFDSDEKRLTWLYSYSWFSFLPLLSPGSILAVGADLSQYFVTGDAYARMWSPFMHHRAILSVFLTLGLIDILSFIVQRLSKLSFVVKAKLLNLLCIVLLIVAFTCQYRFHFALNKLTKGDYWKEEPWMDDTRKLLASVPKGVSVATQQNLVPHLSHRKEIYLIYPRQHDIKGAPCGESLCWWLDFGGTPEYLVVDTRPDQWLTQILETNEHWKSAIENMEKTGILSLEKKVGDARMYRILLYDKSLLVH